MYTVQQPLPWNQHRRPNNLWQPLRNRENRLWELPSGKEKCKKNLQQMLENAMWPTRGGRGGRRTYGVCWGTHVVLLYCVAHPPPWPPSVPSNKSYSAFVALRCFSLRFLWHADVAAPVAGRRVAKKTVQLNYLQLPGPDAGQATPSNAASGSF